MKITRIESASCSSCFAAERFAKHSHHSEFLPFNCPSLSSAFSPHFGLRGYFGTPDRGSPSVWFWSYLFQLAAAAALDTGAAMTYLTLAID